LKMAIELGLNRPPGDGLALQLRWGVTGAAFSISVSRRSRVASASVSRLPAGQAPHIGRMNFRQNFD